MNNDPIFPDGISAFHPREGAPSFIKADVPIHAEKFFNFLRKMKQENRLSDKGFIYLQLKKSAKGTLYFQLNTYNKSAPATQVPQSFQSTITPEEKAILDAHRNNQNRVAPSPQDDEIDPESIPF